MLAVFIYKANLPQLMSQTIKLKRGVKERWETQNIVLASGEPGICFDGNNISIKIGDGVRGWNELPKLSMTQSEVDSIVSQAASGLTSTTTITSLGNIPDSANMGYPVTYNSTIGNIAKARRFYPDIYDNFDSVYKDFLCEVSWSDGTVSSDLQFNSLYNIYEYVAANAPNDGTRRTESYNVECYAKQSDSIGRINKVYGINKFFSILKGKGNYKKRIQHLGLVYDTLMYDNKETFVKSIWDHFTFDGFADDGKLPGLIDSVWLASNYHTMYAPLESGNTIGFANGNSSGRKHFSWGDSDTSLHGTTTMTVTESILVGLYPGGSSTFAIFDRDYDRNINSTFSYVIVYKLVGNDPDDIMALYVKPLGADIFRLNYIPNSADKDLYMLCYDGWGDDQPRVRKLSGVHAQLTEQSKMMSDISFVIDKDKWLPNTMNSKIRKHIGETRQKSFRFFVGDGKGNISRFSPEIYPYLYGTRVKSRTKVR